MLAAATEGRSRPIRHVRGGLTWCARPGGLVREAGARRRRRGRARRRRSLRRAGGDLPTARAHQRPDAAERVQPLAVDVAARGVADEVVERVARVGHLQLAIGPARRAELPGGDAAARLGRLRREQRRPVLGARPVAGALPASVATEPVERLAVAVDQDGAGGAVPDGDLRGYGGGGGDRNEDEEEGRTGGGEVSAHGLNGG